MHASPLGCGLGLHGFSLMPRHTLRCQVVLVDEKKWAMAERDLLYQVRPSQPGTCMLWRGHRLATGLQQRLAMACMMPMCRLAAGIAVHPTLRETVISLEVCSMSTNRTLHQPSQPSPWAPRRV